MNSSQDIRNTGGFSLIELMIAMALGLILMAAVIALFAANQATARTQQELNSAQEAFRFASHTIKRVVQQGAQFQAPANGHEVRVLINPAGTDGYKDCFGRTISTPTINSFFIEDGALRCHVDSDGITETLVAGLDAEHSHIQFGVAGKPYWRDNNQWEDAGGVADWSAVTSLNASLAMQGRDGESLGRVGQFSATMRMPMLARTSVAGGGIAGSGQGADDSNDGNDDSNAGDEDGGDEDSGDSGSDDPGDGDQDHGNDGSGDDGNNDDSGDTGTGGDDPPETITCSCFYRNPGHGHSLVESPNNHASCSSSCCSANDPNPNGGNNRSFSIAVENC